MTDIFRSAFNYLSQNTSNILSSTSSGQLVAGGSVDHPLVGTLVEVEGRSFRIRSLLAEGGFALVFAVQEQKSGGGWFALKRQLAADRQAAEAILQEIAFLRELSDHPAIVSFVGSAHLAPKQTSHGRAEFLLLTELCSGGPLLSVFQRKELNPEQVCKIFYAASTATRHMHDRSPPITHRDLKIENLLFDSKGSVKLCDFGSATTDIFRPTEEWNALRRNQLEEEMARFTTPMYRAPEILDTYSNFPIGPSQDVWALGCILYYLCYRTHPFEDSAKLRIINAKYTLPSPMESPFSVFHSLIQNTLQPNPYSRPSVQDICERVEDLAFTLHVDLSKPLDDLDLPAHPGGGGGGGEAPAEGSSGVGASPPARPPPPPPSPQMMPNNVEVGAQPAEVFAQLKGQGLSLFKNLKEKSTALAQSVGTKYAGAGGAEMSGTEGEGRAVGRKFQEHCSLRAEGPPIPKHRAGPPPPLPPTRRQQRSPTPYDNNDTHHPQQDTFDPFATSFPQRQPSPPQPPPQPKYGSAADLSQPDPPPPSMEREQEEEADLLGGWDSSNPPTTMHRNVSAPGLWTETLMGGGEEDPLDHLKGGGAATSTTSSRDPFGEFLATAAPNNTPTAGMSGRSTPAAAPNYSRTNFAGPEPATGGKGSGGSANPTNKTTKMTQDAFDEILTSQGFSSTAKGGQRTLGDLKREEMAKEMDPIKLKILDWTKGKERNIRALLGSLNEVIWEEVSGNWSQPAMADLLSHVQIKKSYHKACLVVHPDKLTGTENEQLARAIFKELNDAWNKFEAERKAA